MTLPFHRPPIVGRSVGRAATTLALFVALFAGPAVAKAASGYLGVHLQDLDDALLKALDLDANEHGVLVSDVVEDSPAEKAGLESGDVIVKFDGAPAKSVRGLTRRVRRSDAGEKVKMEVLRKGHTKTMEVTLGESPSPKGMTWYSDEDGDAPGVHFLGQDGKVFGMGGDAPFSVWTSRGSLGVRIEDLDKDLGHYFGADDGVLVLSVNEDSPAEKAGVRPGDVIQSVDGEKVEDSTDLHAVLSDYDAGDSVEIGILRDKQQSKIQVELDEANRFAFRMSDGDKVRLERTLRRGEAPLRLYERQHHLDRHHPGVSFGLGDDEEELETELQSLKEQLQELREQLQELKEK